MGSRRKNWVKFAVVLIGLSFPVALWVGLHALNEMVVSHGRGPVHRFQVTPAPAFLPDAVALARAIDALRLDGYDLSGIEPFIDDRSTAPDGTKDRYFQRNTRNPNSGSITFMPRDTSDPDFHKMCRNVSIEFKDGVVECQVWAPK